MIKAKSVYIQALPGTGKTTIIKKLRDLGYYAVDGDDITRVYPKSEFPSRGERFSIVMSGNNCPDVVLSSYWAKDFLPEMNVRSAIVFGKVKDAWLSETLATRPDLHETFDSTTLSAWCDSYLKLNERVLRGDKPDWCGDVVILDATQYVSDYLKDIVDVIEHANRT
jgi:hypothetical protein